jgi:hypothetical protein
MIFVGEGVERDWRSSDLALETLVLPEYIKICRELHAEEDTG